jgi:hypothetical protein
MAKNMNKSFRKIVVLLILAIGFSVNSISAQDNKPVQSMASNDPEKAQIITSDIDLFWRAYDMAKPENNLIIYRDEYFKKGSSGLKEALRRNIGSSCNLVTMIDTAPKYYASLRTESAKVENYKPQMIASFKKLKEIYPNANFPPIYFVIGRMNNGGSATIGGLIISVEMYGKTDDASITELNNWQKTVVNKIDLIPNIVAHELIHYQQKNAHLTAMFGGEVSLLGKSLSEGSASFIGELIASGKDFPQLNEYGNPREKELWLEFKKEMNGTNETNWLYQANKAKDKPADLGYYIGYKIVESYYNKATDKKQAIKDILEIKDFNAFLIASGYGEKF